MSSILYKHGTLTGIRYSYSALGILLRIGLLTLFFIVTVVFASGRMNWENWLIPVLLICGLLVLSVNKKKAVYSSKTHLLTVYAHDGLFIPKSRAYKLPASKDGLVFHTQQRVEKDTVNSRPRIWVYIDIQVKLPDQLIDLDSIMIESTAADESNKQQALKEWEQFFSAIYDPASLKGIHTRNTSRYLEVIMWCTLIISGAVAFYLNLKTS